MTIIEKLNLQHQVGGLVLFREGLFLRAYNESCYILTQLLPQPLKTRCYQIKKYKNQWIIECGFPYSQLASRLPKVQLTDFGVVIKAEFDLSGYDVWFAHNCCNARKASDATNARDEELKTNELRAPMQNNNDVNLIMQSLELTIEQVAYLANWQKGIHPIAVDLNFIESLTKQIKKG